jgi:cytochrome P450 family 6
MELLISLIVVICALSYYLYRKIFYHWERLGITQFPISTIKRGNLDAVGTEYHISQFFVNYYKKTKELGQAFCGLYFSITPVLLLVDLELIKDILVRNFNNFPNRGMYFNEKDDPVSAHLFNIENDQWRSLRQKISPVFTTGKLKLMISTICDVADKLVEVIDKQMEETGQLEVKDTLARFTTDVIGSTAFGIDCNSLNDVDSKFYEMGTKVFKIRPRLINRLFKTVFKDLSRKLQLKSLPEDISSFYLGITKETVKYREKNPSVERQDFINLLLELKKQNIVTVEQIAAQSFVFFLAG